jgi:PKD repeat protein
VTTATSGPNPPTSYTVTVDGGQSRTIPASGGTTTYSGLAVATHTVALTDVPANCTASGGPSQSVPVTAGGTATAPFTITCTALTGTLNVTTSTSGGSPDPNGYTFAVDGGTPQSIGLNQTIPLTGVTAASHTVQLGDVASNCTVTGGTSRTVTVPAGGSATASFPVSCPTPNQPPVAAFTSPSCTLLVCNFTSTSHDPDGTIVGYSWTFGDGATSTAQNPSHVYALPGTYTVGLTVTDNQGATGTTSQSLTVVGAPPPPANRPPSVTAGGNETVPVGALYSLGGASFSDPDHNGPWTVTIAWGDGTSDARTATSEGSIGGPHSYPVTILPADYQLTVTVRDAAGATASASKTVRVLVGL